MPGLDCDQMTVLWPNDWIILSFYYVLTIRVLNVTTFVKEVFWLDVWFRLWRNGCFVTKWVRIFVFLLHIIYENIKSNNFC